MTDRGPPEESPDLVDYEPIPRADDFSADFVTRFSMGYTEGRVFFLDFRAPDVRAFPVEGQGSGGGSLSGQPVSVSQVQLPPTAVKELHDALGERIAEYEAEFGEIELDDDAKVYSASMDSMLLARAAVEVATPDARVLDVGTGSGYVAAQVAETGATVVGADLNPHACREASEQGIPAVRGDLVAPFRADAFDLVVFNPPYLPGDPDDGSDDRGEAGDDGTNGGDAEDDDRDWLDVAMYGGETGRGVIDPFVDSVGRVLAPGGAALIVMGDLTGVDAVRERARANGFRTDVVAEESDASGRIVVLRLTRED